MTITLANGIKQRLFLLHIEIDSHNSTDNTAAIDDISVNVSSVSLWIFGMIFGHHRQMTKKNRINQKYDTFAIHL